MDTLSWRSWTEKPGSPLLPASSALWLLPSFLVRASPLIRYQPGDLGFIDDKKMCDSVDLVNTYMGLPKKVDCKAIYSTEFFTKVEMPK